MLHKVHGVLIILVIYKLNFPNLSLQNNIVTAYRSLYYI